MVDRTHSDLPKYEPVIGAANPPVASSKIDYEDVVEFEDVVTNEDKIKWQLPIEVDTDLQ